MLLGWYSYFEFTVEFCPGDIRLTPHESFDISRKILVQWTEPIPSSGFQPSRSTGPNLPQAFVGYGETIDINYTFEDDEARSISCKFAVSVDDVDDEPPVVTCPDDIITNITSVWHCEQIIWEEPGSNNVDIQLVSRSSSPGDCFDIGTTPVIYEFRDLASNTGYCQFSVTVLDVSPPEVLYCPPNTLHYTLPPGGKDSANVTWPQPKARDNSNSFLNQTMRTYPPGSSFAIGSTNVTYTFQDGSGNQAFCEFQVILSESTDPNPELYIITCPDSMTVDTTGIGEEITWDEPTTNQADLTFEYSSHLPGDIFPIGVTRVTYQFRDISTGNSATCSFLVAVQDTTPPVISSCPQSVNVDPDSSGISARLTWVEPTATDNSGSVQRIVRTSAPGDSFSARRNDETTYTISYVFSDPSGNREICEFELTVLAPEEEGTPPLEPVHTCPDTVITNTPANSQDAAVWWTEPRIVDSDSRVSWSRTHAPGSYFPIGTTEVTYSYEDENGMALTCSFDVIVRDVVPPKINNCPLGFNRTTSSSSISKFWTDPTASDNSGESPTTTIPSIEPIPVDGIKTFTYEFEDSSMNIAMCIFDVNVRANTDNTPPTIESCPGNIEVNATVDSDQVAAFWDLPTSLETDVTVVNNFNLGDMFPIGVTRVTYVFTDVAGNSDNCEFDVIVLGKK
ncbi:hypothetical protein BSL78_20532 [Apostichopus japonicus]|uniref:HYR domain-containing protein n=1 Tax=Stichopus japonicus TaxID=307972 RepID=A0A2G8K3L3_STIJA|nr:hypothetical protein BSL78_20532 [Apostichopus japonicus]